MRLWDSPLRSRRAAALTAGALAVVLFANSLANGFAFDDNAIIRNNEAIHSLESLPGALWAPYWPGEHGRSLGLWRPVVTGLFGLEWAVWEGNPVGFHLLNVLLHGAVTALVVLLLAELIPLGAAWVGGLLFATHPVHVEAVSNVVGRAEILSAFFFLLACMALLRGGRRLGVGRLLAILLLFALAFLSKESAITLVGVALLLDAAREDLRLRDLLPYLRRRWPLYLGLSLVAGGILSARWILLGNVARPFPPLGADILEDIPRIWTVAATWPHLVRLLFFPWDLVVDYGPAVIPIAFGWNPANVVGVIMVLAILVLSLLTAREPGASGADGLNGRTLAFGVLWLVITLSPTSNLFFLSGILLSERTLYLPSLGFVAVAGWFTLRFSRIRPRAIPLLLATVLVLLSIRSFSRTATWKNDLEVFNTLITEHPESGRSQWILGDLHWAAGRKSEALRAYRVAIGILGGHYTLMTEMGRALMDAGYLRAAETVLTFAWKDRPDLGEAPGLLASVFDRQGRIEEVEVMARLRLSEDSTDAVQHHLLSRALEGMGRFDEAAEARRASIRHGEGENWEQWGWLASVEMLAGDTVQARAALDSARRRVRGPVEAVRLDSLAIRLFPRVPPSPSPDSANNLQNPILSPRKPSQ